VIRKIVEGTMNWLPDLSIADLPHPLPQGVSLSVRQGELGIEVQGVVGALPLRNGDTLLIVPKIGYVNFFRMVFEAEGYQPHLNSIFKEFVEYAIDDQENLAEVAARRLFQAAEEIMIRGPIWGRVRQRRHGVFAQGQIDPVSTSRNLACRKADPVVFVVKERTQNNEENRVITEALIRAWHMLNERSKEEVRNTYLRWLRRFPRPNNILSDLDVVNHRFAKHGYSGVRDYYRRALMLAKIVLGLNGFALDGVSPVPGEGLLLNSADIFEKYLRNVIRKHYSKLGYIVTKGGVHRITLYTNGALEMIPDIVVEKDDKIVLIADAKYKAPSATDHYQLVTYMMSYNATRGLLLSPSIDGSTLEVREYQVAATPNKVVYEVYLPIRDLNLTETYLRKVVEHFGY